MHTVDSDERIGRDAMRRLAIARQFPGERYEERRMPLWLAVAYTAGLWGGVALAASVLHWL